MNTDGNIPSKTSLEQIILIFIKMWRDVTRYTCCTVLDCLAGFPPCEGTWLSTPFFLDNRNILHTADHISTNFKVC